ncbi:MAG: hypothetical protein HY716_17745 [Planctomycetes bacterium]|nr:hypothetical protein [Planctomycetota bacterium]
MGLVTSATNSSLTLTVGTTYYIQVRAISGLGLTSPVSSSDGVKVVVPPADGGGGGGGGSSGGCGSGVASGPAVTGLWFGTLTLLALAAAARPGWK